MRQQQATPAATFEEICTALKSDLIGYSMTPVAEGEVSAVWVSSGTKALQRRSDDAVLGPALVRGSQVLLDKSLETSFAGQRVALQLRLTADNGQLLLYPSLSILGVAIAIPTMVLSGIQQFEVPLGLLGARLVISVSGWAMASGILRFNLDPSLATSMWFVPPVHFGQVPVSLPFAQLTRAPIPAVSTPADLVALLALHGQPNGSDRDPGPTVQGFRDPRLQVFASGVAGWGPNWREDRLIRPFANTPRPEGIQRAHVEIGPQRGAGNVYVVGWTSAQETDFDFILHMGNTFLGGWGEIDWRVVGFYYDESPFPAQRSLPRPQKASRHTNGHARAIPEELEQPLPEAGGSVRI
ncbi:MAG: hypothetical protein KF764_05725 [Labilithrix sp.]|nr:hypothetical protein [Labilithrix sp.]